MLGAGSGLSRLDADPAWTCIDCLSDLHLSGQLPTTRQRMLDHIQHSPAQAICLLGDVFEVWVGDDALGHDDFLRQTLAALRQAAGQRRLFFMHGNRDFLLGPQACAAASMTLLDDPCLLVFGQQNLVLSHGDALCLDDHAYQNFRQQVRSPDWQTRFLAMPLNDRLLQAQRLRAESEAQKTQRSPSAWADADPDLSAQWLAQRGSSNLIHGHTHRPGCHPLPAGGLRWVTSDWDFDVADAAQQRGDVLRIHADGRIERHAPMAAR